MSVRIYHNPRCSKSRQALEILQEKGQTPEIIEYLKTPPAVCEIAALLDKLGLDDPRALMRKGEAAYKDAGLDQDGKTRDELIGAMAENPILIERPIVISGKGARIGRPPEKILEIL